jgi:nitrous oxide reductase accessory protein NosL
MKIRAGLCALAMAGSAMACSPGSRPPAIRAGMECASCGMEIRDLRFACERRADRGWRRYDAIECLLRDGTTAGAWLMDYDGATLHAADSLWVVRGSFPSPMGGGLAAFLSREAADRVAALTSGHVGRLDAIAAEPR